MALFGYQKPEKPKTYDKPNILFTSNKNHQFKIEILENLISSLRLFSM